MIDAFPGAAIPDTDNGVGIIERHNMQQLIPGRWKGVWQHITALRNPSVCKPHKRRKKLSAYLGNQMGRNREAAMDISLKNLMESGAHLKEEAAKRAIDPNHLARGGCRNEIFLKFKKFRRNRPITTFCPLK